MSNQHWRRAAYDTGANPSCHVSLLIICLNKPYIPWQKASFMFTKCENVYLRNTIKIACAGLCYNRFLIRKRLYIFVH